jgi:DNA transposition AAA+ family ATPase
MAINDGTVTSARGFSGTITGLIQESVEETNGARSITKVKDEANKTAEVVVADPFVEKSVTATVLSTYAGALRLGSVLAYGTGTPVKHLVTAHRTTSTPKFQRIAMTLRKEGSMTYV